MAIDFYKQSDRLIRVTAKNADGSLTTQNVSAWTMEFRLGLTRGAPGELVKLMTLESNLTKTFTVALTDTETLALAVRQYVVNVKRIDAGFKGVGTDEAVNVKDAVRGTA